MDREQEIEKRLAIIESELFERTGTFWHETGVFSDGAHWGRCGSMTHLIDKDTKRAITKGFHSIKPIGMGRYEVSTGAYRGEFRLKYR